jgi:signal transduction histidine kinase
MPNKLPKKPAQLSVDEKQIRDLLDQNQALNAIYQLNEMVYESLEFGEMADKMVNLVPQELGFDIGILALVDQNNKNLEIVAASDVPGQAADVKSLESYLKDLEIPLKNKTNTCVKAVRDKKQHEEMEFHKILTPALEKRDAERIEKGLGIKNSIVSPLYARKVPVGVLVVSTSRPITKVTDIEKKTIEKFSESIGLILEHSKLFTDLKHTKENLNKAYKNLKALDEMKDEFLSVAAHELRTPMTIIMGYIWMILEGKVGAIQEKQKNFLDVAMKNSERMIALINDMLNVSRMEKGPVKINLAKVDVCKEAEKVVESLSIKAKDAGIFVKIESCRKGVEAYADKSQLNEIFMNLIGNAVKFTREGGVTVKIEEDEQFIKTTVSDTGIGIQKKDLKQLFHKFGRIDASYKTVAESSGTGLGLYIVKLYIGRMGGKVGAESGGVNKGSSFWFTLPKSRVKVGSGKKV